ncbi:hypothetical protein Q5P01_013079 [Channa striata]|uniref:Uncharacterized protein n=1 Tax=Channa striata TaxID=64152 RepID=A0AA88MTH0_CHASR|nr:hypothetical protein Q5P01_013079 [Channa striata]
MGAALTLHRVSCQEKKGHKNPTSPLLPLRGIGPKKRRTIHHDLLHPPTQAPPNPVALLVVVEWNL